MMHINQDIVLKMAYFKIIIKFTYKYQLHSPYYRGSIPMWREWDNIMQGWLSMHGRMPR